MQFAVCIQPVQTWFYAWLYRLGEIQHNAFEFTEFALSLPAHCSRLCQFFLSSSCTEEMNEMSLSMEFRIAVNQTGQVLARVHYSSAQYSCSCSYVIRIVVLKYVRCCTCDDGRKNISDIHGNYH